MDNVGILHNIRVFGYFDEETYNLLEHMAEMENLSKSKILAMGIKELAGTYGDDVL